MQKKQKNILHGSALKQLILESVLVALKLSCFTAQTNMASWCKTGSPRSPHGRHKMESLCPSLEKGSREIVRSFVNASTNNTPGVRLELPVLAQLLYVNLTKV